MLQVLRRRIGGRDQLDALRCIKDREPLRGGGAALQKARTGGGWG